MSLWTVLAGICREGHQRDVPLASSGSGGRPGWQQPGVLCTNVRREVFGGGDPHAAQAAGHT